MDKSRHSPRAHHDNSSASASRINEPLDWSTYNFFSIDSAHTIKVEDAIHISASDRDGSGDSWHLDLKVVHPLPLKDKPSLPDQEPSYCLGFSDQLPNSSKVRPSISIVLATNSRRLVYSEVASIPIPRAENPQGLKQYSSFEHDLADVVEKLTLLRLAALRVSIFEDRELRPEYAVNLIMTHTQQRALEGVRDLPQSPALVVFRASGSRTISQSEAHDLGFSIKAPYVEVREGVRLPRVVRPSEPVEKYDTMKMKQNCLSGLINSVQISCALLGIEPLPDKLVEGCGPKTIKQDKLVHMTTAPQKLRTAIEDRRGAIREVLSSCSLRPPR